MLPLLFACAPVQEQHAAHEHHAAPSAATEPATVGQRWIADAPLREGMVRVRSASLALAPLDHGHLDAQQVVAQAGEIRAAVDFMFANCRLAAEPDAALHPLLAQLIGVSQALKDRPSDPAPLADLHAVIARYAQMFDEHGTASPRG